MFVSANQFYVILACLSFGVVWGVVFSFLSLIKRKIKIVYLSVLLDILFFVLLSGSYVLYSHWAGFPSIRAYMPLGVLLGICLYMKSFHLILAKVLKMTYNKYVRKLTAKRKTKDERGKV